MTSRSPEPDVSRHLLHTEPGLGRALVYHDKRSRGFGARAAIDTSKPRTKIWRRSQPILDQGESFTCVAQTGLGIMGSSPITGRVPRRVRALLTVDDLYAGAQFFDEWPGSAYEGSSGLGLCKYLASKGLIGEYRWCFSLDELRLAVAHLGPVGFGANWTRDMADPDSDGVLHATGEPWGGHEVEIRGVDERRKAFLVANSWGRGWGLDGEAWLGFGDAERLMADQGDAFVITG